MVSVSRTAGARDNADRSYGSTHVALASARCPVFSPDRKVIKLGQLERQLAPPARPPSRTDRSETSGYRFSPVTLAAEHAQSRSLKFAFLFPMTLFLQANPSWRLDGVRNLHSVQEAGIY